MEGEAGNKAIEEDFAQLEKDLKQYVQARIEASAGFKSDFAVGLEKKQGVELERV